MQSPITGIGQIVITHTPSNELFVLLAYIATRTEIPVITVRSVNNREDIRVITGDDLEHYSFE